MLVIVSAHGSQTAEFDFDSSDDFEVFRFQILSLFEEIVEDFVLIDFAGRELQTLQELNELSVATNSALATKSERDHRGGSDDIGVYVWVVNRSSMDYMTSMCSAVIFPNERGDEDGIIQPRFRIIDTPFDICLYCQRHVSSGLIQSSSDMGITLQPFHCKSKQAFEFGLTLDSYQVQCRAEGFIERVDRDSPLGKYLCWHFVQEAVTSQRSNNAASPSLTEGERQIEGRLRSGVKTIQVYEDMEQQRKARECIDFEKVCGHAQEISNTHPEPLAEDELCMRALLVWFKRDFFKWFKKPNCSTVGCPGVSAIKNIHPIGGAAPTAEEQQRDWAGRVELYQCKDCSTVIRFPRINNPSRLLETRTGRCGEFANAFCLICRSLGVDANWVMDFTDHVWVEVYLQSLGRYVHADPCEKSLDAPLTYEAGWNKKLSYIFSFSRFGVTDVIHRYSRKFCSTVCQSRSLCTEKFVRDRVEALDCQVQSLFQQQLSVNTASGSEAYLTLVRFRLGSAGFSPSYYSSLNLRSELSVNEVIDRKRRQKMDLQMLMFLQSTRLNQSELQGRISGEKDWKESRGEAGEVDEAAYKDIEGMRWLQEGTILASGYGGDSEGNQLDIFVSSVGHDDIIDSPSNCCTSGLSVQHARLIEPPAVDKVLSPYSICVNNIPVLIRPGRGHNVALLCAHTGAFLGSKCFDTWGDDEAGDSLVAFLQPYLFPISGGGVQVQGESGEPKEQSYVLVMTVLDSGENGGLALSQLVDSIMNPSCHVTSLFSPPAHRESWLVVALIGEKHDNVSPGHDNECEACTGNFVDMDVKEGVFLEEITAPVPVRELLHFSSAQRGMGPSVARVVVPLCSPSSAATQEACTDIEWYFREVDMYVPGEVTEVLSSGEGESISAFTNRVKGSSLLSASPSGGFVITSLPSDQISSSGEGAKAYLFSITGFPLQKAASAGEASRVSAVFVKSATPSRGRKREHDISGVSCFKYISLGGKHHPDTVSFDTTLGLGEFPGAGITDTSLADVLFAGDDIVESVRCQYLHSTQQQHLGSVVSWSPALGSAPPPVDSSPPLLDCIAAVSVQHGDLIDSITLRYSSGRVVRAGGSGGSTSRTVEVDTAAGERVVGFFGGIGGHIHHFGVIVQISSHEKLLCHCAAANHDIMAQLSRLACKHDLWSDHTAATVQQLEIEPAACNKQYSAGRLLSVILSLHCNNSTSDFRKCIQASILYTSNIIKNIDKPMYHCIKLSNKNIQNFVLSLRDGLPFFLCSPVHWRVCFLSDCLTCSQAVECFSGAALRKQWLEAMSCHCKFLTECLYLKEFQVDAGDTPN